MTETRPSLQAVTRPLRRVATVRSSNVDKVAEAGEELVRLCNYVDVYYNDRITGEMEFSQGSAKVQEIKKFGLRAGDVVITKDSETPGDIAVPALVEPSAEGIVCGYHLAILRPHAEQIFASYLFWALNSKSVRDAFSVRAQGITRYGLTLGGIGSVAVPVPDLDTQKAIAAYLDRSAGRIDKLIARKERIADLISAKREALIHNARNEANAKWIRLNTVARRVKRPIGKADETSYVPLGLYNRGRGFFRKAETEDKDLGDSDFFWVRQGDIVFSGQFAWEGAIGFVTADEDGCVVSHRYPVYRAIEGVEGGYLYAFFRTDHGSFLMDNCSRGAAGRNRPLNPWSIERELVLIPSEATQKAVVQLVSLESKARRLIREYVRRATELRAALITAAVTGQINVREGPVEVTTKPDRNKFRLIVGAEIVHRHCDARRFGRIKNQKLLYLAEAHAGINELGGSYIRFAAGPYDEALIKEIERGMEAAAYYRAQPASGDSRGVTYVPLAKAGQHQADLKKLLGDRTDALRRLIDLLHDFDTETVEAIATLYAVWNDALMDDETPDDAALIRGVLREWHPDKVKFTENALAHWIDWMRRTGVVPHGQGPRTAHTMTRDLFA